VFARRHARRGATPTAPRPPPLPQLDLSVNDVAASLGDVAIPEESKRTVAEFFGASAPALRAGLQLGGGGEAAAAVAAAVAAPPLDALSVARGAAAALPLLAGSGASATLPQLRGLEWRLDVDVARRHAHDLLAPSFLLRVSVYGLGPEGGARGAARAGGGAGDAPALPLGAAVDAAALAALGPHAVTFSADFATLKRAAMAMDEAAAELRTAHAKRVTRYIR